jgi:predicted nucleic acid-binding Zn ribbon protein
MSTRLPLLGEVARQAASASEWQITVRKTMSEELGKQVQSVTLKDGQLVVFTESAAWAARLRYALSEAAETLQKEHQAIREIVVRVSPKGGAN